jgi:crotonobetainyl-CoA:carnitine CoA-transferase CaiB-like acyl-CoA transferase
LVGSSDPIFVRLCRAMEQPELATDPRFETNVQRTRNHVAIDDIVAAWCARHPLSVLSEYLDHAEVPFTKVYSIADVMDDPHFQARGAFMQLDDPELGAIPAPAVVPRFVSRTAPVPAVGPKTGQDNAAVYASVGVGDEELERLQQARIV